jgi:hypothetical protein
MYDCLDCLVSDLSKSLNQIQLERQKNIEEQLKTIRENSIRAGIYF